MQRAELLEFYPVEEKLVASNHQQRIVRQVFRTWPHKTEVLLPIGLKVECTILTQQIFPTHIVVVDMLQAHGNNMGAQDVGSQWGTTCQFGQSVVHLSHQFVQLCHLLILPHHQRVGAFFIYLIRPVELAVLFIYLFPQPGDLTTKASAIKLYSLLFGWLCRVNGDVDGIARACIYRSHGVDEHLHGVRHIDVHGKRTVVLKLDDRGLLLAHDIVAHDDGKAAIQLVKNLLRNLLTFRFFRNNKGSLYDHIAAMQAVFAQCRTGIVLQLGHLSLFFFLFCFQTNRCKEHSH